MRKQAKERGLVIPLQRLEEICLLPNDWRSQGRFTAVAHHHFESDFFSLQMDPLQLRMKEWKEHQEARKQNPKGYKEADKEYPLTPSFEEIHWRQTMGITGTNL